MPSSNWIGGLDLNKSDIEARFDEGTRPIVTLLSTKKKIQSVRIGDEPPRVTKSIDFAGCVLTVRRDDFACVADTHSYSLLDIERQLKIHLFPISSEDTAPTGVVGGSPEDVSGQLSGARIQRSSSSATLSPPSAEDRGHGRSTSLGTFMEGKNRQTSRDRLGRNTPDLFRESSPVPTLSPARHGERNPKPEKPLPVPPSVSEPVSKRASMVVTNGPLKPHIISPSPQEFLLVVGTSAGEPGVGMFVNLEGEVTRSTLDFSAYPEAVVADGRGVGIDLTADNAEDEEEGYVMAVIGKDVDDEPKYGLEIQRWDIDHGDDHSKKYWLQVPESISEAGRSKVGIRAVTEAANFSFDEVVQRLRITRFKPVSRLSSRSTTVSEPSESRVAESLERQEKERRLYDSSQYSQTGSQSSKLSDEERTDEELQFAKRLGRARSRIVVWSGNNIWWAARNPLAVRLDAELDAGKLEDDVETIESGATAISHVIDSIRGREARTEIEYMSMGYIRQRAGLLLLIDQIRRDTIPSDAEYHVTQEALLEGGLDPRVVVALSPSLRGEVVEGRGGIWIPSGIKEVADEFLQHYPSDGGAGSWDTKAHSLQFYRRFLTAWRRQKGNASISNEHEKFCTVDAALLLVLLELDKESKPGFGKLGSVRAELNDMVDHGVECFDRAVQILETHHRLYVLSRLCQSRKMAGEVLATWRRIIEGERDDGGEFTEGEQRVREYLAVIRNPTLVEEYGVWLAARNPKLGVQVFADERSRVSFEPKNVVAILRADAPGAVKEYLEYLVFGKGMSEYGTELIAYYLDIVLNELETNADARQTLELGYETYRALALPKPTYRQFIAANGTNAEWWHARLRLLQLLGGLPEAGSRRKSNGADEETPYDLPSILARIEPYRDHLVPELIILDGRQGRHDQALRLLVHGLGDYDTAINYCLAGGSSLYHPVSGTLLSSAASIASSKFGDNQHHLFDTLLTLFLTLPDTETSLDQTSNLLARFGRFFDVLDVLGRLPEEWGLGAIESFLVSAIRTLVQERNETLVVRALRGSENLQVSEQYFDKVDELGYMIEGDE